MCKVTNEYYITRKKEDVSKRKARSENQALFATKAGRRSVLKRAQRITVWVDVKQTHCDERHSEMTGETVKKSAKLQIKREQRSQTRILVLILLITSIHFRV